MSGEFKLANGSLLLSTEAPGGIYNSEQLKKIASLCEGESAVVKATEDQRIALFVPVDKAAQIAEELQEIGLGIRNYQDGLHQPTTCIGEMCSDHLQDAMGSAMDLTSQLSPINLGTPLKIGINGCASCCVPTHTLDISIIGDMNGYRISLGGKNSQIPEMASFMAEGVPTEKLCDMVEQVVKIYDGLSEDEESLQDVMERCGSSKFIEALAPYSQDASGDDPMDMLGGDLDAAEAESEDSAVVEEEDELNLDDLPDADEEMEASEPVSDVVMNDDDAFTDAGDVENLDVEEVSMSEIEDDGPLNPDELGGGVVEEDFEEVQDAAEDEKLTADSLMAGHEEQMEDQDLGELEDISDDTEEGSLNDLDSNEEEIVLVDEESDEVEDEGGFGELEDMEAEEFSDAEEDAFEEKINASIDDQESFGDAEDPNSGDRMEAMKLIESDGPAPSNLTPINAQGVSWQFAGLDMTAEGSVVLHFASGAQVMLDPNVLSSGQTKEYNLGGQCVTLTPNAEGVTVDVDGVSCYLPRNASKAG